MSLLNKLWDGAAWVSSLVRMLNTNGTPLVSAVWNGDGRAIADEYALTFAAVVASATANVTVGSLAPNNPYRAVKAVVLDGVTIHKDVIPGLDIVFSAQGTFVNAWTATVKIGEYLGTFDAEGVDAGVPTAGVKYQVLNNGTGAVTNALARLLPNAKWVAKVGKVFSTLRPFAEGATERVAGGGSNRVMPYVLSITGVAGAGAGKTATLQLDGVTFAANSLLNLSTGATQSGAGVKAVAPGQFYRVVLGNLTGLEFALDAAVANGDTANVLIFAPSFEQIAPDVAGAAGAWGTVDVVLTEAGQGAGQITAGGAAYYWRRSLIPVGADPASNPRPVDIALQATETGAAGWLV